MIENDDTGAAIRAAMEADGSLERDRLAVSGEKPYDVVYGMDVDSTGGIVVTAHYSLRMLDEAYAEHEIRASHE